MSRYIARRLSRLLPNSLVLNAGSGDGSFELREHKLFHLDLVISSLNAKVGIAGSIEAIGIRDEAIDALICVGSVLNYADPCKAIGEFSRVIKRGGHLILEFERITSGESLRRCKKSSVAYYRGIKHYLCLYSETYVGKLLQDDGFLLDDAKHFHIASNILLKATGYTSLAGVLAVLDPLARLSKPLRSRAGNVILGCVKNGY